jgi:hypothetical protein
MDVQRLELKLSMRRIRVLWLREPLVDDGGWLCGTKLGRRCHRTKSSKATIPGASRMDKRTIVLLILPSLYRDEKQNKTDSTQAEDRCY